MKGIIVYFSASGNTKIIARAIHRGMKRVMDDCEIAKIKELKPQDLSNYDLIGLGSPVWRLGVPNNVQIYLHKITNLKGKPGFLFCTHGVLPVVFMKRVASVLTEKGLTIIGWNDWYGGVTQLPYLPKPYFTDGHPDDIDIKEAEDFGREMAERGQRISQGETQLIPKLPEGESAGPLWQDFSIPVSDFLETRHEAKRQMKVNMAKCKYPECTLCVDNCPMDAIDFSVSPPVFKSNCHEDFLCWAICPEGAIETNFGPVAKAHDVVVRDLFIRTLDEAEAKGLFRRHVPLEKIGWNTHIYESTKIPRCVIPE